ncbi:UNVERIFIED_CONTAM: hypothetical protein PYX00_000179 [Menopon gallinae]|uniref:Ribosome biogenesis regulatory protein n=1 Tax=Menopon gallinae TaxID=328185 RepID=A0AAW2I9E5_9NEOP
MFISSKMETLEAILGDSEQEKGKKAIQVEKTLEVKIDEGALLASDSNELNLKQLRSSTDSYLKLLARDNVQLLINKIWELPTNTVDGVTVAVMPAPKYVLPRALPVPKPKELTKWEKFAKEKGIQKKKKDKLKWDDILQKWVPLHGYKRAQAEKDKTWVLEVPDNADPYEDQFEKLKVQKSERVAKNEFQRLRNLAKAKNIKLPKAGFIPTTKPTPSTLGAAITVAKSSTASLGKFQPKLPKEVTAKNVKEFTPGNKKRKLPMVKPQVEKSKSIEMIDTILKKKPKLNLEKAVDTQVHAENKKENDSKPKKSKKPKGKKVKKGAKGGKFRGPKPLQSSAAGGKKI